MLKNMKVCNYLVVDPEKDIGRKNY